MGGVECGVVCCFVFALYWFMSEGEVLIVNGGVYIRRCSLSGRVRVWGGVGCVDGLGMLIERD